jgi:hypothetical protein
MAEINGSLLVKGDVTLTGEIKNLRIEQLVEDPIAGDLTAPRLWVNTTTDTLRFYNGTATVSLGAAGAGGVTPEELDTALADYTTTTALTALLGGYTTDGELTTALSSYVLTTALTAALAPYAQSTDVTDEIATAVTGLVNTTQLNNAIDNALAGLDFQADVLGREADFAGVAGRYILTDGLSGITPTVGNANDIVEVTAGGEATVLAYDVSAQGPGALVWDRADGMWLRWNGTDWAEFGGISGITPGDGIETAGDVVSVKLDGATLTKSAAGLKVGDLSGTYVTPAALTTALEDYPTETEMNTKVAGLFFPIDSASATTHTITHNLGYRWPNVIVVDAATNKQITPDDVEFTTVNELVITLGVAAAIKGGVSWLNT